MVKEVGPLPVAAAVGHVLQAARGLEFAHRKGVVHRDIKPANLLLDLEGTVKVLDMGLARLGGEADVSTRAELTGTGAVMGTVDYMAPEQAVSTKHADARADIYSLGCTLYYLLTARPAYVEDTLMARLIAHREAPIPALGAGNPAPAQAAFERMVAKRPEDRFQTMTEVVSALEGCLAGVSLAPAGPAAPRGAGIDDDLATFFRGIVTDTEIEPGTRVMPTAAPAPAPAPAAGGVGRRRLLVGVAAGLLGLMVLWGIVVTLRTKDGTLVVEIDQPDAVVKVFDGEGKVEIGTGRTDEKGRFTIGVDPGKHRLKVEKDGFTVYASEFEVVSGKERPVRAHLEPLADGLPAPAPTAAGAWDTPEFRRWMSEVAALPAAGQAEAAKKKLMERNPGYGGEGDWKVEDRVVMAFATTSPHLVDLAPLQALPALTVLRIKCESKGRADLSGLAGLKLTHLYLYNAGVTDLSSLKGMPLEVLDCPSNGIADLSPLKGMPLWLLNCPGNPIADLSPLRGMRLGHLACDGSRVTDLSPLKGMGLECLGISGTGVSDLRTLEGMHLSTVHASDTPVTDLTPLAGMKIKILTFPASTVTRGIEAVRSIDSFEQIGVDWGKIYPPREFWGRYDRGEFSQATTEPGGPNE